MKNRLADRRGGWVADCSLCRSWVAVKIFVFVISQDFHEIFNFVFRQIFLKFHEIQNNFVKISWDTKSCFAATLCRSGVNGGAGRCSPGTPSALTQIVPYSSSLYTVFHSVIYNSVLMNMKDDANGLDKRQHLFTFTWQIYVQYSKNHPKRILLLQAY